MIDLKDIQAILGQRTPERKNYPKHVIINLFPLKGEDEEKKKEDFSKILNLIIELINLQVETNLPILTLSLGKKEDIHNNKALREFTEALLEKAMDKKINITVFGKWYDLQGELVEKLKKLNNETKDFDHFFLNLCINYDSKQELADACRVIIRKVYQEKEDPDSITPELIKENVYSSNFIPPDLIIETGTRFRGTFLWDSPNAKIYGLNKELLSVSKSDILKVFDWYAGK